MDKIKRTGFKTKQKSGILLRVLLFLFACAAFVAIGYFAAGWFSNYF